MSVVLKLGLDFKCLIIRINSKCYKIKMKEILLYQNCTHFYALQQALVKKWNEIFHCFSFETSMFKSKFETSDKSCFSTRNEEVYLCSFNILNRQTLAAVA